MDQDQKQCETCAWPLDCSEDLQANKPSEADCPRETQVWNRRVGDASMELTGAAALTPEGGDEH